MRLAKSNQVSNRHITSKSNYMKIWIEIVQSINTSILLDKLNNRNIDYSCFVEIVKFKTIILYINRISN